MNVTDISEMINVKVQVNSHCTDFNKRPIEISGLLKCLFISMIGHLIQVN